MWLWHISPNYEKCPCLYLQIPVLKKGVCVCVCERERKKRVTNKSYRITPLIPWLCAQYCQCFAYNHCGGSISSSGNRKHLFVLTIALSMLRVNSEFSYRFCYTDENSAAYRSSVISLGYQAVDYIVITLCTLHK